MRKENAPGFVKQAYFYLKDKVLVFCENFLASRMPGFIIYDNFDFTDDKKHNGLRYYSHNYQDMFLDSVVFRGKSGGYFWT